MANYDVILCGNPGIGKSTILSSISGVHFTSGVSFGEGLTARLEFKDSPKYAGVRFGDTPGLADIKMAQRAAEAITAALQDGASKGRRTLLFFVVTVEAGRIRPDDLFTIKQVMGSIKLPGGQIISQNNYGVIVNKCTFLDNPSFINGGKQKIEAAFCLHSNSVPYTSTYIKFLPNMVSLIDQGNATAVFEGLEDWIFDFYGIEIESAERIDVSSIEEKLLEAKEIHSKEMSELEKRLTEGRQEEVENLQRIMEETRRAMQAQIEQARQRNERRGLVRKIVREVVPVIAPIRKILKPFKKLF